MHLVLWSDVIDTDGTSQLKPATYYFGFKDKTQQMTLQHGCRASEIIPMYGILRLQFQAIECYEGHLLGSWGWGEFRYFKLQTAVKKANSSEAINNADTYTGWVPFCLVWQHLNANVTQNPSGKGRKG